MFVITADCPNFSLQKFPFDTLKCSIILNPFENVDHLEYSVSRFEIDTSAIESFIGETEIWSLVPGSIQSSVTNATQFTYWEVNKIELSIQLQRKYQYYIAHIFLPQTGLFILQFSCLLLPPDTVERPAFSMTVVLAYFFILDMIFKEIPKTTMTVYVVVMTVVKLYTSIFLTIYMLLTCKVANVFDIFISFGLETKMRKIDKLTCAITIVISLSIDFVLFNLMLF